MQGGWSVKKPLLLLCGTLLSVAGAAVPPSAATATKPHEPPIPLGPSIERRQWEPAPTRRRLESTLRSSPLCGGPVSLVRDGKPMAALVLAQSPSASARAAAGALARAVKLMSDATLPIVSESDLGAHRQGDDLVATWHGQSLASVVLVGDSRLARDYGMDGSQLPPEGYRLKTIGNVLLVCGCDARSADQPLMGTRHGAMGLLERHLGFRWLWPGESGEVFTRSATVVVPGLDEEDAPAIRYRGIRNLGQSVNDRLREGLRLLGFGEEDFKRWHSNASAWWAEQQLGGSLNLSYGHAFSGWWARYGKEHPEWFALQPNGSRTQKASREQLCMSNSELAAEVARRKIAELRAAPKLDAVSISPNDGSVENAFCMCEECRKLDPPNAAKFDLEYPAGKDARVVEYPMLSDRFVTFYSRVAEAVARECPERWVGAYAYSVYRSPPLYAKVAPNLLIGYVGMTYFNDNQLVQDRQDWEGWAHTAQHFFWRPNLLHQGHTVPAVYVAKLGRDIKRCYATGMEATDFDSLVHHWALHGVNYYVLAKLLWDPSRDVEAIVQDYCEKGFGPAAGCIREYFRQIEAITDRIARERYEMNRAALRAEEKDWLPVRGGFESRYYGSEVIESLAKILESARRAAGEDAAVLRRIEFLSSGLRYAALQAQLRNPLLQKNKERGRAILQERHQLLRQIFKEQPFAVNGAYVLWREGSEFFRCYDWTPEQGGLTRVAP